MRQYIARRGEEKRSKKSKKAQFAEDEGQTTWSRKGKKKRLRKRDGTPGSVRWRKG